MKLEENYKKIQDFSAKTPKNGRISRVISSTYINHKFNMIENYQFSRLNAMNLTEMQYL